MTLQAYIDWNTLNLGRSAAVAYLLLILVIVVATVYVSFVAPAGSTDARMTNPFRRRSATDLSPRGQVRRVHRCCSAGRSSSCSRSTGCS